MEILFKMTITAIGGAISYVTGWLGVFFFLMLVLMIFDFITGLQASKYMGIKIESGVGIKGLIRKTYIILLVLSVYAIEYAIAYSAQTADLNESILGFVDILGLSGVAGSSVAFLFAVMELVSIIENGLKMGAKLPAPLRIAFEKISKYLNGEGDVDRG